MKNKRLTLVFLSDPGHGWLRVKRSVLQKYSVAGISPYSYQRNGNVYLEEDCDAGKLLEALKAAGVELKIKNRNTNRQSKVRSYERYSA